MVKIYALVGLIIWGYTKVNYKFWLKEAIGLRVEGSHYYFYTMLI